MLPEARLLDLQGVRTRIFRGGSASRTLLLVHGGECSGLVKANAFAWELAFPLLCRSSTTVAFDTAGSDHLPGIEGKVQHLQAMMDAEGLRRPHIVAHDEAAVAALLVAVRHPEKVGSVTVVGSRAAPTGDALPNLAHSGPPHPLLSARSQAWALERLSWSEQHIAQGRFLEEAVALAERGDGASELARAMALRGTLSKAKSELFGHLRESGLAVPALLVWGLQDPIVPLENGLALYRQVAIRQSVAQMRVINRAGNMPFRDQPAAFADAVASFILALPPESVRSKT